MIARDTRISRALPDNRLQQFVIHFQAIPTVPCQHEAKEAGNSYMYLDEVYWDLQVLMRPLAISLVSEQLEAVRRANVQRVHLRYMRVSRNTSRQFQPGRTSLQWLQLLVA
jgi:hypothetical protein